MANEFRLPDIGEGLTEAEIVRWHIAVGDPVTVDQTVVELETDKAVVEIPSPFAGIVLHHGASEGDILPVGEILVVVGDAGEIWTGDGLVAATPPEVAPIVGTISSEAIDLTPTTPNAAQGEGQRLLALPVVRKLARDLGVALETVTGTGPGGRITREDVQAAAEVPAPGDSIAPADEPGAAEEVSPAAQDRGDDGGDERRPLSRLRRTIAANMTRSWSEIPHVTTFDHVDASRLLAVRRALSERHDTSVPIDALIVAAVAPALRSFPSFNATLDGDELVLHGRLDIGVAVDTPDGLMVAVITGADQRSVLELAGEVRRLGENAKRRTLTPAELTGQTFTVSNIGAVGGGLGTPIVPYGTVGILSVGRAVDTPVARDGRVEIAPVMPLSLSYDHRVVDGGEGRRFMAMVIENLLEPALFLA
ncbi:MAG: dihydrolipoamide acetyltransferase family protein [Acidimicrobiia bacterium]